MVTFCYYISDYGYGHATRSIALIRALINRVPDSHIIVKSDLPFPLLHRSLQHPRITVIRCRNDIDFVVHSDAPVINREQTFRNVMSWMNSWDSYMGRELQFCRENRVDVIISDIVPQSFLVAEELGIPGIAVSNFSWDTILEHLYADYDPIEQVKSAYRSASLALVLPFHTGMDVFPRRQEVGLLAREQQFSRLQMRLRLGIPDSTALIFLGGGGNHPLHQVHNLLSGVPTGIRFVVPTGSLSTSSQVIQIPPDETESQNWIGMCDLVVTKCGYSTVSEAVQAQIPLMVWKREGFIEDHIIAGTLEKEGLGVTINYADINSGSWQTSLSEIRKKTERFDMPYPQYKNSTSSIAGVILEFIA